MPTIPISSIQIKKNEHGNYEHPETKLVFSREEKKVIGRQLNDGTVAALTSDDIDICDQFKFTYTVPETIDLVSAKNQQTDDDTVIEKLDDIIADDDDDFEEFYEEDDE